MTSDSMMYEECKTCLNFLKRKLKIPNQCGCCSKSEGFNWRENPIAMIEELDSQILELQKRRDKCKKKLDIIVCNWMRG